MQKINLTFLGEGKKRLDVFIAENTEISRTRAQGLINDGMVTVNGKTADKNCKLKNNDEIAVEIPKPREYTAKPQNIQLDIAY